MMTKEDWKKHDKEWAELMPRAIRFNKDQYKRALGKYPQLEMNDRIKKEDGLFALYLTRADWKAFKEGGLV